LFVKIVIHSPALVGWSAASRLIKIAKSLILFLITPAMMVAFSTGSSSVAGMYPWPIPPLRLSWNKPQLSSAPEVLDTLGSRRDSYHAVITPSRASWRCTPRWHPRPPAAALPTPTSSHAVAKTRSKTPWIKSAKKSCSG
jgi:hypothetical protein